MEDFPAQLQVLLADRHSAEARAFFQTLFRYVGERVNTVWQARYRNLLGPVELEEVVSEVGLQLMMGALARFRGTNLASMMAYVRTIADRSLGHAAYRRIRERDLLRGVDAEDIRDWQGDVPGPERLVEFVPDCPLAAGDQAYLIELLQAGSKAEYARQNHQSRAAVTRMVQRIRQRIDELSPNDQAAVDVWMHNAARDALAQG